MKLNEYEKLMAEACDRLASAQDENKRLRAALRTPRCSAGTEDADLAKINAWIASIGRITPEIRQRILDLVGRLDKCRDSRPLVYALSHNDPITVGDLRAVAIALEDDINGAAQAGRDRADVAFLLLSRWENIAKNGGEKWLREHPLVKETTDLLNEEAASSVSSTVPATPEDDGPMFECPECGADLAIESHQPTCTGSWRLSSPNREAGN